MRCPYCGCSNAEDEHRCRRCGRRMQDSPALVYPIENSAAVRAPEPAPTAPADAAPVERAAARVAPRQAPLFAPERGTLIPFETIAPERVSERLRENRARRQTATRRTAAPRQAAAAPERTAQQNLFAPAPAARQAAAARQSAAPRSAVSDEAEIAPPMLRLQAAALDAAICAAGIASAGAAFLVMGGSFAFARPTTLFWAGAAAAIVVFYHLFWSILGRETAGMRGFGLRVLTFDGQPPRWSQRVGRLVAGCLSLGALGLGMLWALTDEESLAWHDHITKTFPTVRDANPSTFHRK